MSLATMRGWFDPRGRISRPAYVRLLLRAVLAFAVLACASIAAASLGIRSAGLVLVCGGIVICVIVLAQTVRRLHDRDRTGWWLLLSLAIQAVSVLPLERAVDRHPALVTGYALASLAVSLWLIVEVVGRPGTPGPNRFGAVPGAVSRSADSL